MREQIRDEECHCEIGDDRRAFLRRMTELTSAVLLGLGLSSREATALPISLCRAKKLASGELSYPLPEKDGANIDKENEVIVVRHEKAAYAFALSCPHQNTALRWEENDSTFKCPKHKSKYQSDGTFISGRATRNMDRLPIRSDGTKLFVDGDKVFRSDKDPEGWAKAMVTL